MDVKLTDIFSLAFWSWLVITIFCIVFMFLAPAWAEPLSGTIMALFMVLPVRDWSYHVLVWAIDYVSSINTPFKDKVNPHLTYNRLVEPTKRYQNNGVYRSIKFAILIATIILALLWMVFQGAAFNVVYSWLHTLEFLFTGKLSWLSLLFYVLVTVAFWCLVFWSVGQVLNATYRDRSTGDFLWNEAWRIVVMVLGFYAKIILSAILLRFTLGMFLASMGFWTIVVGLPITVFTLVNCFRRRLKP